MQEFFSSRREALKNIACGFGSLALAGMCNNANAAANPLQAKPGHHPPRAKRIIFLFMQGGPSHVDTFDPKAKLDEYNGKKVEFHVARTQKVTPETVMKSPWEFKQYGECGQWVSDLFPEMAKHVDDLCFIRSMHTEGVAHGPATLFLHTGATNLIRPSMGAWVMYGLGSENENLPGFITINPPMSKGGPRNYSNAFLPSVYQGTSVGRAGMPTDEAKFHNIKNPHYDETAQQQQLQFLQSLNREQAQKSTGDDEVEAAINSFELAYRMQSQAPGIMDLSSESKATLDMYGINKKPTDYFGRQCLLARRFAEAGVRYIQINYSDTSATPRWDQHSNLKKHEDHAKAVDQPVSALLQDLKKSGLLEDTLVWWGGEFGRTPYAQNQDGRDHNPNGFTVWLAGGGVKPGLCYGETDEFGYHAIQNKVHMHDLHATILHLLGLNHEQLTYRYAGRDFRLTDVYGRVVHDIIV